MAEGYEPPKGTTGILVYGLVFTIIGVAFIPVFISSLDFVILIIPIVFGGVGVFLLWLYKDLKDPNGKYTIAGGNRKYNIMKRCSTPRQDDRYWEYVTRGASNGQPIQNMPDYDSQKKKKSNATNSKGVYSYMNCPNCGALNEAGADKCRNCGKKL